MKSSRLLISVLCPVLAASACSSLWEPFLEKRPTPCVDAKSTCPTGEACNSQTKSCEAMDLKQPDPPAQWKRDPVTATNTLFDVWGLNSINVWAIGGGGLILRWNGVGWQREDAGLTEDLHGLWGNAANEIWAVGDLGKIIKRTAPSWTPAASPTIRALYKIYGVNQQDIWAVGLQGTIVRNQGAGWNLALPMASTSLALNDVWTSDSSLWIVGQAGLILS